MKNLLVLARAEQVRPQPRSAAHHLPELRLRAHQLEEDEIDDFGHVDSGVEHVDGDGDVRSLRPGLRNSSIKRLRVVDLEVDHPRKVPCRCG